MAPSKLQKESRYGAALTPEGEEYGNVSSPSGVEVADETLADLTKEAEGGATK